MNTSTTAAELDLHVCTWIFGARKHAEIIEDCLKLGLRGVELFVDPQRDDSLQIARAYRAARLDVVSFTPLDVDICASDSSTRERALAHYRALIELASDIGAPMVTCHERVRPQSSQPVAEPRNPVQTRLGGHRGDHPTSLSEQPRTPGQRDPITWKYLLTSCAALIRHAEDMGVILSFEALSARHVRLIHRVEDALALWRALGHANFRLALDTFHLDMSHAPSAPRAGARGRAPLHLLPSSAIGCVQWADRGRAALGMGGFDLDGWVTSLQAKRFTGPHILECSSQLPGPRLEAQRIDSQRVRDELAQSRRALTSRFAAAKSVPSRPAPISPA